MKVIKKIVSLALCAAITANMLVSSVSASSYPATGESQLYTYNGYSVEYKVTNEWTGNQIIEVIVTNTGDELLADWSVGYNAGGKINSIWNAQIYAEQGTEYILRNAGYNSEIAPGQSVSFGYIVSGDSFKFPQNIFNCSKRVDITDNYDVYYNIVGDYGSTYQAEMVIENHSDIDYSAWQLSFDGNVTIDNLWNGKLMENNNGSFKVKNAEHNTVIYAGNSTSFNFGGTKLLDNNFKASETMEIQAYEPVAENPSEDIAGESVETTSEITDAQISETDIPDIDIEETADTAFDEVSVEYSETNISADTDSGIIFDNYKLTAVVIPIEFDFEYDPKLDSDEDGLPDFIERGLGSDRFNPDTDGDGLPDGYEYYSLGTDPTKIDSDDNGISDADEDFDEDGLTNIEEYNLSTHPFVKDSDYDGLSDYDEVYKYNTDPTSHDTDEDKVTDGDEVILGLDPNNPATFGYPDSEYTTEQTVEVDSSALQGINDLEDNPFTISVDITAAGVADNCLTAGESGYSYPILQNDAVLGVVPELSYSDGLTVKDVIINFNIVDSAVSDRIGAYSDDPNFDGVNRFNIFKYFEEDNILLPVETFYDETENRVYTHVDRVGTYCLIDMEKWVNNLENTEPGNYYLKDEDANEPANIVFCIDTRSIIDDEAFEAVKSSIKEIAEDAFDRYVDIKVYIYYQKFGSNFKVTNNLLTDSNTGENYFIDFDSAEKALNGLEKYLIKSNFWAYDYTAATQFMLDTCDENIIAMYHIVSDQRVMGSADKTKRLLNSLENDERVYISTICPFSDKAIDDLSYAVAFAEKTNGIVYTQADFRSFGNSEEAELIMPLSESENYMATMLAMNYALSANKNPESFDEDKYLEYMIYMRRNIVEILGEGIDKSDYTIISSTGLTEIKLDAVLRPQIYYEVNNIKPTDTDKDGLSDWNEVNTTLIKHILTQRGGALSSTSLRCIKNEDLPTLKECVDKINLDYVSNGYIRMKLYQDGYLYGDLMPVRVLPICSDPVDADSDNDGIPDYCDMNKLCKGDLLNDFNESCGERNTDTFIVIKEFSIPLVLFQKKYNSLDAYPLPKKMNQTAFTYGYNSSEKIYVHGIIKTTDDYWIKIKNNNNGKMGYVKWDTEKVVNDNFYVSIICTQIENYQKINDAREIAKKIEQLAYSSQEEYQTEDVNNKITRPKSACMAFSFAAALSYFLDRTVSPNDLVINNGFILGSHEYTDPITETKYVINLSGNGEMINDFTTISSEMDSLLNSGKGPLMFHIKYPNRTAWYGEEEHWALITGKEDGEYIVYDPYNGRYGVLSTTMMYYIKYGDDNGTCIYGYGVIQSSTS